MLIEGQVQIALCKFIYFLRTLHSSATCLVILLSFSSYVEPTAVIVG